MQVSPTVTYNAFFAVYIMPLIGMFFLLEGFLPGGVAYHTSCSLCVSVSNTGNCQCIKVYSALSLSGDSGPSLSTLPNKLWRSLPWAQVKGKRVPPSEYFLHHPENWTANVSS